MITSSASTTSAKRPISLSGTAKFGDVSQSHKAKLIKKPSGILRLHPSRSRRCLIHKHMAIPRMLCDLRYVVIDEVHSLMRGDRGGQALSLSSTSRMAGVQPRRIGLSATIGGPERTGAFLSQGTGRDCVIPRFEEPRRVWRISMEHFYNSGRRSSGDSRARVLKRPRCLLASVLMRRRPRHCRLAPKTCAAADSYRRNAVNVVSGHGQGRLPRTATLPRPPRAKSTSTSDRAGASTRRTAPDNADPGMGYILSIRAAASAWSLPTRVRRQRPCVHAAQLLRKSTRARPLSNARSRRRHRCATAEELMRDEDGADNHHHLLRWSSVSISRWNVHSQIDAPFTVSSFCSAWGARAAADARRDVVCHAQGGADRRTMMPETIPWKLSSRHRARQLIARKSGSSRPSSIDSPTACSTTRLCRRLPAPANSRGRACPARAHT